MQNAEKKKFALIASVTIGILTVVFGVVMIFAGIQVFRPNHSLLYKNSRCKVLGQTMNGTSNCTCFKDEKDEEPSPDCQSSYPCVRVQVNYKVENDGVYTNISSTLTDDQRIDSEEKEIEMEERKQTSDYNPNKCSLIPLCSEDASENNQSVYQYLEKYGNPGTEFICFYDPKDNEIVKVWPYVRESKDRVFLYYLAMALFILGSIGSSTSFKYYKLLLLQEHQQQTCPQGGFPGSFPKPGQPFPPNVHQSTFLQPPTSFNATQNQAPPPPPYTPTPSILPPPPASNANGVLS